MARPRSALADYSAYLLVRLLIALLQALPLETGCALAHLVAGLAFRLDRRHRDVAQENLRHAFPEKSPEELEVIVRGVYRHFCRMIVEIALQSRRVHAHNWRRYQKSPGLGLLVDCLLSGRPLLCLTGHLGNWEVASYNLGLLGFTVHPVARPLDNPYLDRYLRQFRERRGQRLLDKNGDLEAMQKILEQAGVVATLADQDAGRRGLFVDFFGRPASTHKAIALLAMEHRVPILVVTSRNLGAPMAYELAAEEVILPEEYDGRPDAIRAITQRFTNALERAIRRAPEQYLWLHRRWKHQPAARKRPAA
jgi:KDO2-lipid IV(A) lauroyltransferase